MSFNVEDAGYFMDGWGIEGVDGDIIQLEGQGTDKRARVVGVDYETNTIQIDKPLTWTNDQGIALAYEKESPDMGAHEFTAGDPAQPGKPQHLRMSVGAKVK
jgi:hypothetical protein